MDLDASVSKHRGNPFGDRGIACGIAQEYACRDGGGMLKADD